MRYQLNPMGDTITDITTALNNVSQVASTYQQGGISSIVQPAIPYLAGYAIGIALLSAVFTLVLVKKLGK